MRRGDDEETFSDLLDLSFGGPRTGVLDLGHLRRLLLALLSRLGIRDVSAAERFRGSGLLERVRACEDGLEQALRLAREVQEQMSTMKQRAEELHVRQQGLESGYLDELKIADARLRDRVDALEAAKADGAQMEVLRQLIGDTDRREACRVLDERVRLHEDAIERLAKQCRQLDDLQEALDRTMSSLTSDPSERRGHSPDGLGKKLSLLLERKMADGVRRQREEDAKIGEQASILKLQSECDKLQEAITRLHDDNKYKQIHIQQLLRTSDELQENKVDKRSLHAEVKKQLDEAQRKIFQFSREKPRSPEDSQDDAGEAATAAGIRKQLLDSHHCLSCDRQVVRHLHAAKSVSMAWPNNSGSRTFLTDLTHFRYPPVSRSCGGGHTVTLTPQRRLSGGRPRSQTVGGAAGPV